MGAPNISFYFYGFDNTIKTQQYRHLPRTTFLQLTRSSCQNIIHREHNSRKQIIRFFAKHYFF